MAEWENGLCSHICGGDLGTCAAAWCCSCFLFGRTSQRLEQFPKPETPEKLFERNCGLFCLANYLGVAAVLSIMQRIQMREKFGIEGNAWWDCVIGCCCTPCTMAQMEMEVKQRAVEAQQKEKAYSQPQGGMQYQPQFTASPAPMPPAPIPPVPTPSVPTPPAPEQTTGHIPAGQDAKTH